jgi:hypothetical protein
MTTISCLFAIPVNADLIQISNASGTFELQAQSMDLFNSGTPNFSSLDLAYIHSELNNNGITTDGKITLLPVNTIEGLSFLTLVDEELGGGDNDTNASLGITSTASSSLGIYINDFEQDSWQLIEPPFGSQTFGATFVWGRTGSGDGFGWTDLSLGDAVSYSFTDLDGDGGAIDAEAFQFVGWNDDIWEIISTNGFKLDGTSIFTGMVIPAPPAAIVLTAFVMGRRKRRR